MIQPRRSVAAQLFFVCAYILVVTNKSVRASQSQEMGNDEEVKRGAVGGGMWWKDLGVMQKNGHSFLLNPFSGFVENGHVCGIIGPSGSGKSTLLAALGGSTLKQSGLHVSGSVWIVSNDTQTKSSLSIRYDSYILWNIIYRCEKAL
jgi:ABC-type transport system involved in cytochrome bd biosynthesis fused ATPase/permease subunit